MQISNSFYDIPGQQKRRKEIYDLFTKTWKGSFDSSGKWIGTKVAGAAWANPAPIRQFEILHYTHPFLGSGDPEAILEANAILKNTPLDFCHFTPLLFLELLNEYKTILEDEAIGRLEKYLTEMIPEFMEEDLNFVGVNDNFPIIATYIVLIGGQYFNNKKMTEIGIDRLGQLEAQLRRCGVLTEFNTPSYTANQLHALALIVNHLKDRTLAERFLACEHRVWIDLMGHYHLPTARLAGPYSRAYSSGSYGPGNVNSFLYLLLGDALPYRSDLGRARQSKESARALYSADISTDLHCPSYLVDLLLNRNYPASFIATTEFNSSNDELPGGSRRGHQDGKPQPKDRNPWEEEEVYEYPSGRGAITTWLTKEYTLGTSVHEFHSGEQTESFFASWPLRETLTSHEQVRTIYARYISNEKKPGQENFYPHIQVKNSQFLLLDEGRKKTVQHQNAALVVYKPKHYTAIGTSSLKLSLILALREIPIDEIWLGDLKSTGNSESKECVPVFLRDGKVYVAIVPLAISNLGRKVAVRLSEDNGFQMINFYNYEGAETTFKRRGHLLTQNGFVCEMGSEKEYGSFENFRKQISSYEVTDKYCTNPHMRATYTRIAEYKRAGLSLGIELSPVSEGIRYRTVNGYLAPEPKLEMSGLDLKNVPLN